MGCGFSRQPKVERPRNEQAAAVIAQEETARAPELNQAETPRLSEPQSPRAQQPSAQAAPALLPGGRGVVSPFSFANSAGPDEHSNLRDKYKFLRKLTESSRNPIYETCNRITKDRSHCCALLNASGELLPRRSWLARSVLSSRAGFCRYAVKLLPRGQDCAAAVRGIENHLELSHPHIIDIKEVQLWSPQDLDIVHHDMQQVQKALAKLKLLPAHLAMR